MGLTLGTPTYYGLPTTTTPSVIQPVIKLTSIAPVKSPTIRTIERVLTTTAVIETAILGSIVAPVLAPFLVSTALGTTALSVLAPKTFETIIGSKDLREVAIGTAISPAVGIVIGAEKGINVLGTVLGQAPAIISEHKGEIISAVGGLAVGVGSVIGINEIMKTTGKNIIDKAKDIVIPSNTPSPVDTISGAGNEIPRTPTLPITPETVYMDEKPSTTPQKTTQEGTGQKINQRVDVLVNQNQRIVKYKRGHRHHKSCQL